jgi:hypothetical protein
MVASALQLSKRALLATMRAVAVAFGMTLTCNRDPPDRDVVTNFQKLALRVHPDRVKGSCPGRMRPGRPVKGDVILEIPLRRYKSSCHPGNRFVYAQEAASSLSCT